VRLVAELKVLLGGFRGGFLAEPESGSKKSCRSSAIMSNKEGEDPL